MFRIVDGVEIDWCSGCGELDGRRRCIELWRLVIDVQDAHCDANYSACQTLYNTVE